jgi:hypothetical protein
MKKFHVIDKTRKDQYYLPSVVQSLLKQRKILNKYTNNIGK